MSETRKLAAILVADVVGYSRLAALLLTLLLPAARAGAAEYYGYDQGGSRFAPLDQITPENVDQLIPAWTYHTGDLKSRAPDVLKRSKFEATPILTGDKLIACTPFNAVVALDPGSGRELWRYDPEIKTDYRPANMFACRGVAVWHGRAGAAGPCAERILTATADLRQAAALARGVPVHLATRRDRRPGHPGLLDRRQSAGRRAARHGARLRCPNRRPALGLGPGAGARR
jgi:glucose dehydrogenase